MKIIQLICKALVFVFMAAFLFSTTTTFAQNLDFAQSLEGKWIPPGEKGIVMQFTKDSVLMFSLDKRIDAKAYQIKGTSINIGTKQVLVLQYVNPNRLRVEKDRSKGFKDIVRLKPTETNLTSAEIKKRAYFFANDDKKRTFRFNKPNEDSNKTFKLEKIDSTYFLSQYSNDKRRKSARIESVTPEKLVVYISPKKSMTLLVKDAEETSASSTSALAPVGDMSTAKAIIGKWFYKRIEGRPSLSDCTKKTFFQFTEALSFETKPYAENRSNGNCVEGSSINGTYEVIGDDQIEVTQHGKTETWKIQSITKTMLEVERDGRTLTLTKE